MTERETTHAVAFDGPEAALAAVRALRKDGFNVIDAHTPFAVHGMDEALGFKETRLPWATFAGGAFGLSLGLGFQLWTHAIDWPLNIGGKTNVAWQALIPIAFEVVVLMAAFATVGALLFTGRLFPRFDPKTPDGQPLLAVSDDAFVLLVCESDGGFSLSQFRTLCNALGATKVIEGWRVR